MPSPTEGIGVGLLPGRKNRSPATREGWKARPFSSLFLRFALLATPVAAGMAGAVLVSRLLPRPSGLVAGIAWWLAVIAGALGSVLVVERAARRWLPLAALLELSLVFPDRAPSRLTVAQQVARTRDLERRLQEARELGIDDEPTRAAHRGLVLILSLGVHDRKTRGHSERVRVLADMLAEKAGVPKGERDRFRWSALLHDIGKISVPARILNKPDRPDLREWAVLRRHPSEGARIAGPLLAWLGPWAGAIEHHHERYDGKGYPHGLAGKEISLGGRILAVADAYEVMTAARSYKKPMTAPAARWELARNAGSHFDPELVRAFLDISLGRLVWAVGLAGLLAQLPVVGRLWLGGVAERVGRAAAHTATAVVIVAAVAMPGAPLRLEEGVRVEASSDGGVSHRFPARVNRREPPERREGPRSGPPDGVEAPGGTGSGPAPADQPPPGSKGEDRGDEETPREERPARAKFSAVGRIKAGNPLGPDRGGVTLNEFLLSCSTPASQGIDGWVFEIPSTFPEAGALASARGENAIGAYDLDMRFFSSACDFLGAVSTKRSDEVGRMPGGTRFAVVSETRGIDTEVLFTVTAG